MRVMQTMKDDILILLHSETTVPSHVLHHIVINSVVNYSFYFELVTYLPTETEYDPIYLFQEGIYWTVGCNCVKHTDGPSLLCHSFRVLFPLSK